MTYTQSANRGGLGLVRVLSVVVDEDSWGYFSANSRFFSVVWRRWVEVAWALMNLAEMNRVLVPLDPYKSTVWRFAQLLEERQIFLPDDVHFPSPILEGGKLRTPRINNNVWLSARALYNDVWLENRALYEKWRGFEQPTPAPQVRSLILALSACPPLADYWMGCVAHASSGLFLKLDEPHAFLFGERLAYLSYNWWEVLATPVAWQYLMGRVMANFPSTSGEITVDSPEERYYFIRATVGDDDPLVRVWVIVPKTLPQPDDSLRLLLQRLGSFNDGRARQIINRACAVGTRLVVL